jgi:hypothetical protein
MDVELDLDKYELKDLLVLFRLNHNFTAAEFKDAKKIVHAVHPDKSGLSPSYFIFFCKAYKLLAQIHDFKTKRQDENVDHHLTFNEITEVTETDKQTATQAFTKNKNYNKKFNELFEKHYVRSEEEQTGYGEWLSTSSDQVDYETRKKESREVSLHASIEGYNTLSNFTSLGETPASFSNGKYEDLKHIYTTGTVIGVSEKDFVCKHGSLEELKQSRTDINPYDRETADSIMRTQKEAEDKTDTHRAFKLMQQEEANKKQQKSFWSSLLQIK